MPFSFNFVVEETEEGKGSKRSIGEVNEDIVWKKAKEIKISDEHFSRISALECTEVFNLDESHNSKSDETKDDSVEEEEESSDEDENEEKEEDKEPNGNFLNFINSGTVVTNLKDQEYEGDLKPALDEKSDLVAGVYEGGLKIWECSEDLVRYLHSDFSSQLAGSRVLELGCGSGLPGVYAFSRGAEVDFNDYNGDVLNEITIPNVLLNVPNGSQTETRYFAGDWGSLDTDILRQLIVEERDKYDLILTSETIYNPDNHSKLLSLFSNYLKPTGKVLIAAKVYYFGVGGGTQQFADKLGKAGFTVETVKKFSTGVSREILQATLRPDLI